MTTRLRRRYRVRLRAVVAGSFLAAASAASLAGVGAAPVMAAPSRIIVESLDYLDGEAGDGVVRLAAASTDDAGTTLLVAAGRTSAERLAGVGADLDRAVLLRLVTPEQAGGFYDQVERRVAAGL